MPQEHRSTARVLDILEYLALSKDGGSTLTELSVALDAPKSSLFPILHTLLSRKYIRLDRPSNRYYIGISAYALGGSFADNQGAVDFILQVMEAVVESCEETCQMGVLDRDKVLYIRKVDSPQPIRMISHVGNRLPANGTAIGKALLSDLKDEEVRELYADGFPRLTEHTVVDFDTLLGQLAQIRKTGIAWEREESAEQLYCWAVPLRRDGQTFAALSVAVPMFRCSEEKKALVLDCLTQAKREIELIAEARGFLPESI
ncbi:IclR family transcriptional regulator [Oscillibacter sp.]|uniref:IclR family transcriptional regulator n=1 Tax=Oscillibacter sp. TaxID=1945593 RepID=UPI0028A2D9D3|nr:IclR family transcriptional regulator [Oscillibacter sp.]